jgi:PAS domain S-box-containing protein
MSQTIAGEIVLDRLIKRLMTIVLQHAGAVRGLLLLPRDGEMRIVSRAVTGRDSIAVDLLDMPRLSEELPESLLQYVARSFENVVLDDASRQNEYSADPYILAKKPRSILCMPLVNQHRLAGVLYLENNLAPFAFSRGQRTALHILGSQAAISLENANLYSNLRQSQEQANRAEREFRRSFDSIPALAWSAQPDGTPDFFNKQWYAYTGISAEEAPARWIQAFHPDEVQQVADKWAQIVRAGVSGEIEARICRSNIESRIFLIRTTPIRDEKGAIVKWYGTATDIEALREAQVQLAHVNRVATMGQLTASIAHEVNQPIAATITNAQAALRWLEKNPPNLGEVRQSLESIVKSGNRASVLLLTGDSQIGADLRVCADEEDRADFDQRS